MDHEEEVAFLHVRVGQQLVDVVRQVAGGKLISQYLSQAVQTVVDSAADCLMCEPGSRHLVVVRGRRCVRDGKH